MTSSAPSRATPSHRAVLLLPAGPALALLIAPWLPLVNTSRLWFGVPALFVWTSVWVLLITPALYAVDRTRPRADEEEPS